MGGGEEVLPALNSYQIQQLAIAATKTSPDIKMTAADWTRKKVLDELKEEYEFTYVNAARAVYYRRKPNDMAADEAFHKLTDIRCNKIITDACKKLYPFKTMAPRTVSELSDTIALYTDRQIDRINDNIIKVGKDLYWDEERAAFTEAPRDICMRELFDASPLDDIRVDINDIATPYTRVLYKRVLKHLEGTGGSILPWDLLGPKQKKEFGLELLSLDTISLAPFWTWANEDLDTFNDLLKAAASIFMYHKPKGAFILIGRTRNGKSSYIKMLHAMLGRNNTSAVKLADLEDPHFVQDLTTTMMNAPDEDDEGKGKELARSQSYFKSISAHEPIPLKLLFSPEPIKVSTDFMSFYPMNKLPEWSGSGKEACMRRSLILMFNNDLSKFDNSGHNFEQETYTAPFYGELLAVLCAIASYYRDRPLKFSGTMQANRENVSEAIDSTSNYLNEFMKYFSGYQVTTMIEDYKLWCAEQGITWDVKDMKQKLMIANSQKATIYYDGSTYSVFKLPGKKDSRKPNFIPQYMVPELGKYVSSIIDDSTIGKPGNRSTARSVVAMLNEYYAEQKADLPEQMQFDGTIEDGSIEDVMK